MKCDNMPQYLVSLLYKDLDPEEKKEVRNHLKKCPSCRKAYEELQQTSSILEKWEDIEPKMNLVFVREASSRWNTLKESIHRLSWGRRFAFGIPGVFVIMLIFLSLLHFRAAYHQGEWNFSFGITSQKESQTYEDNQQLIQTFSEAQKETLGLMTKLIQESEARQRRGNSIYLSKFARYVEQQRQQDLRIVNHGLEGLHRTTYDRFEQTSDVLNDLIRLTDYQIRK